MAALSRTVLVVEDERKIRDLVRAYLEREGLGVVTTGSGAEALLLAQGNPPDLVVLDLGLPDVPGEEVARELRAQGPVPIVMLTAKSSEEERIRGLELGADDYVTKPFSPRELTLRCLAILRRSEGGPASGAGGPGSGRSDGPASFGGGRLLVDGVRHEVHVDGVLRDLTPTEYGVLDSLVQHPGRVYSRFELINRVRGYEFEGYERTIDSHVKNLRRKIEAVRPGGSGIASVYGVGYRFDG